MTESTENGPGRRRLISGRAAATIFAGVVCSPTLFAAFAGVSWLADVAASFRVQLFWISLVAAALLTIRWKRRRTLAPAAAWNGALVAPSYFPSSSPAETGPARRILYANVWYINRDHQKLLDLVEAEDPDVVVLVEFTPEWAASLESIRERYPVRHEAPLDGVFGIAMYSRLPMRIEQMSLAERDIKLALLGTYQDGTRTVNILGMHPPPPTSRSRAENRNRQLAKAAGLLRAASGERILIGDLNVTPWSPVFGEALDKGDLRDSRRGFGVQPTFPDRPALLRVPIDHCLVSKGIAIRARRVGPSIGSDHLPLIVDYALGSEPATRR